MQKVRWFVWLGGLLALGGLTALLFYPKQTIPGTVVEVVITNIFKTNGIIWKMGDTKPFTGDLLDLYPDGKILSRSEIKKGKLQGVSRGYYTNAVLQIQEHFVGGVSDGLREKWYPDGKLQMRGMIVAGEFHGDFSRWHTNGQLSEVLKMNKGKADGEAFSYYPSGYRKSFARITAGDLSSQVLWKDGELKGSEPIPSK